ncbi:hypothetical protein Tco_0195990 [Tanacetum coccineum]
MNPSATNQIALDNSLVAPKARLNIGECNRRIEFTKPQREATYQVTLDALKLSPCYPAFLITAEVPEYTCISSGIHLPRFVKHFLINHLIYLRLLMNKLCHSSMNSDTKEILKFYRNCLLITCINPGEHLQMSSTGEHFAFHIDNHFSKGSMPYPRFTKIIINHFISQNKSISMRNRINLHTVRDDCLLGTLLYVSKIEEHQVYGALIPKEMLNEDILKSTAYQTYYAYASGAKEPKKARKFKKPASPKLKIVPVSPKELTKKPAKNPEPAMKSSRKSQAGVIIKDTLGVSVSKKKTPTKGKRSKGVPDEQQRKIYGTDEGTGTKPGVLDVPKYDSESEKESWGDSGEDDDDDEDESDNDGNDDDGDNDGNDDDGDNDDDSDDEKTESDRDENPNLNQFNEEHDEEEEEYVDERVYTPDNYELTDEEDNTNNAKEENVYEEDDVVELYRDINVNLKKEDVEMTDTDQGGADQCNVS